MMLGWEEEGGGVEGGSPIDGLSGRAPSFLSLALSCPIIKPPCPIIKLCPSIIYIIFITSCPAQLYSPAQ